MSTRSSPAMVSSEVLVASGVRTTSGNSGLIGGYGPIANLRVQLNVTAASGTTPSLTVVLEDSVDDGANWNTVDTFAAKTTTGREVRDIGTHTAAPKLFGDTIRISWTISGTTPSFTFEVRAFAQGGMF